ncbi:sensor histidine kinase [Thiocystis violacea]|uniref:sensor histidine kinase n=1 Tax=Thiocystis violacea TaxID=13725 RepID=UPI001908BDB1|nr:ATP-binding protein [Thiocystis violacea]MBK1717339.1 hypothetical protein [Thiocystis violacea]
MTEAHDRDAEIARLQQEITALSATLSETRQAHRAQTERLAAVGELIASVAHELNNPLAIMLGYMELLTRELGPDTWAVRLEIDLILRQIERSRGIIDSLLRIARPLEDVAVLEPSDLAALIDECLALVLQQAPRTNIQIRTNLAATTGVGIGRQDLQQVIINLLVNALHAVESEGGLIEVSSRDWEGRGILIGVRDTGPGVPLEIADRIFSPFFTTKGAGKGTGLGLSVSAGLIRRHGGALTLESTSERGAEFGIWVLREPIFDASGDWLTQSLVSSPRSSPSAPLTPPSCSCDERSPAWPGDRTHDPGA